MFSKQWHVLIETGKGAGGGNESTPVLGELLHFDCLFVRYHCVRPLQHLPIDIIGLGSISDYSERPFVFDAPVEDRL